MLKIETIIERVENGVITQLRIADDVYALIYLGTYDENKEVDVGEEHGLLTEKLVKELRLKEKKHKNKRKKSSDIIGKSKKYKVWVHKEDCDKILSSLGDKKLTTKDLHHKTGIALNSIRAMLDFMIDNGYIQKELDNEIMEPVYYATEKNIEIHQ